MQRLAEKLGKKIHTYAHWPGSRKLGDKLLPFAESEALVFFLADILENERWEAHPEFRAKSAYGGDYVSYATFMHILIQYVIHQKTGYEAILSVLEHATDQAVETVMGDEFDNRYTMLRCIFDAYKAEKHFPAGLLKRLDVVPDDKLRFKPIDDDSAYEVEAYSLFTCGEIKIPSCYKGKPVKKIAYRGFDNTGITGVEIPEGIEAIEGFAFAGSKLKKIILPQSLKRMGEYVFHCCGKLKGEIVIPKNVEKMGGHLFQSAKISNIRVEGHAQKPEGWSEAWNKDYHEFHTVVWGHAHDG